MQRLERFLVLDSVVFEIYKLLSLLDVLDLTLVAIVSIRIVLEIRAFVYREVIASQISGIRSSGRVFLLESVENIIVMVQVAEDHDIDLLEPSLDLVLRTAEVIEHIEKKTRNGDYQDYDNPNELKYTIMVSGIDTECNKDRNNPYSDINRRKLCTEHEDKNDKSCYLNKNKQTEDTDSSDAVPDSSFAFYRPFAH